MRTRTIALIALCALPALAGAQIHLPRIGRRPTPEPAPLPPEAPVVAKAMALKRSRWSAEGYGMVTQFRVPNGAGGVSVYSSLGTGTHGDYRINDHFSTTVDMTASFLNSPATTATAEFGGRYLPLALENSVRPFVDLRMGYMYMSDTYISAAPVTGAAMYQPLESGGRYSRGFGGITGIGSEFALSNSIALTTEISAFRDHLSTYRITGGASVPSSTSYWMTAVRYSLGLRFNPIRSVQLLR